MKKTKYLIGFLLLFMIVGFAAISVTLSIRGTTTVASTLDDFKVYFSNVIIAGQQDLSVVRSETEIYFDILINEVGETHTITYDVTNGSKYYDAQVSITCTNGTEYLEIVNNFNTSTNLLSKETRQGTLSLTKTKSIASDTTQDNAVSCKLSATPVERTTINEATPAIPVDPYYIGREVSIGEEKFNIISSDTTTVKMLYQGSIGGKLFSDKSGWEYSPGPKEIDIWEWSPYISNLVDEYVNYLKTEYDVDVTGDLITLKELGNLGCTVQTDYAPGGLNTCADSVYSDWLIDEQIMGYWTRSAYPGDSNQIWIVDECGDLVSDDYDMHAYVVRPVITISKDLAHALINYKVYNIGEEITIGEEKFNVIRDNVTTVTMLAQYIIDDTYKQNRTEYYNENTANMRTPGGWQAGIGDFDINVYSTGAVSYLNNYIDYLKDTTGEVYISGNLITLMELKELGCSIDETYKTLNMYCKESPYKDIIFNKQRWATRSADGNYNNQYFVVAPDDFIASTDVYADGYIRPVITISKEALS